MNKSILIGRLTKDPDLKYTPNTATAVCRLTLAVDRKTKNPEGRYDADFINIIAFGKPGEIIAQYMSKGRPLAVSGRIQTSSYDGKDGIKRYSTDVVLEEFQFIDSKTNTSAVTSNIPEEYTPDLTPEGGDIPF